MIPAGAFAPVLLSLGVVFALPYLSGFSASSFLFRKKKKRSKRKSLLKKGKMWASERSRRFGCARIPEPYRVRCSFFSFSEEKEKKQKKKSSVKRKWG